MRDQDKLSVDEGSANKVSSLNVGSDGMPAENSQEKESFSKTRRSRAKTFHVSGFWSRFLAAGIDLAIILPVSLVLCKLAGYLTGLSLPASRVQGLDYWLDLLLASDAALLGVLTLTLVIAWIYSFVFHISLGKTLGMWVMKLRIIDVYGDEPSTLRALIRSFGYFVGMATLGLGFIWIAFDSEKRGIQDWIAGTYVVKPTPYR